MEIFASRLPKESALIGCLYAGGATGVLYGFSIYSEALKAPPLGLTDTEVLRISSMPFAVGLLGPISGFIADRLGPAPTFVFGGLLLAGAQMVEYFIAVQDLTIGPAQYSLLGCTCVTFFASSLITAHYATLPVKHFQHRRGEAIALVKSFVGLTGASIAQMFFLFYPNVNKADAANFVDILMWIIIAVVCCFIGCVLTSGRIYSNPSEESGERLSLLWWLLLAWGICMTFVSCASLLRGLQSVHRVLSGILIVLLLFPFILWSIWNAYGKRVMPSSPEVHFESQSKNLIQMLTTVDAWCNFVAFVAICGGGLIINTSMSQIFTAAGNNTDEALVLAQTLFATGNMIGRLTCMVPSDALVRRGIPRPFFVLLILLTMALAHLMYLLLPVTSGSLSIIALGTFAGGLSFGAIYPHVVVITSELFGSKHLATNYMFYDGLQACAGSLVFAQFVVGTVADAHREPGRADCIGAGCFRNTHLAVLFTAILGMLCTGVVASRSRGLYRDISYAIQVTTNARGVGAADLLKDNQLAVGESS